MYARNGFLTLAVVAASAAYVLAADLSRIERRIGKEPAYTSQPKYCLLVFGEEARTRIWLVQDGNVLYVDRNGNGDLTEKDEKVAAKNQSDDYREFEAGNIQDGSLTHTGLSVSQMKTTAESVDNDREFQRIAQKSPGLWTWWIRIVAARGAEDKTGLPTKISYVINGDGLGYLLFSDRPAEAPIVHLNGPWSLGLQDVKQRFVAGTKSELQIGVGTQGVGPGTFAFVEYPNTIPQDVYPRAEIVFPPKNPGDKPTRLALELKQRC